MAYVFVLLASLGIFLWVTPAHRTLSDSVRQNASVIEAVTASASASVRALGASAADAVRAKTMKLLREQLHQAIDEEVR